MTDMIDDILRFNREFVASKAYEPYITDKFPARKLAVLTCMDTRLTELLPKALGLRNGDAKIIKNAGGLILSETDSAIRSLLVGIYECGDSCLLGTRDEGGDSEKDFANSSINLSVDVICRPLSQEWISYEC